MQGIELEIKLEIGWVKMNIIYMLFAHYVLDYPLQGEFLAQTKGKYMYSLLAHSLIYGLGMYMLLCFLYGPIRPSIAIFLVFSHIIIDYVKATAKNKDKALTTYLYIDQALHISINLLLIIILSWRG